ncbi:hypothetical protein [Gluconobacter oxydans]|uniref:Uncharacterized protein n=1 Tax=Gluconobacter oxydans NBRC 3293 TaxID=1315969 RepID=A0A829XBR6_GLUOY|nr:hypothetical protein [Gluconobacter oxydans]GEM17846.1 hypothetical protein NBRC3293_2343 [Gluconobacter oxydans NBRC 3293]
MAGLNLSQIKRLWIQPALRAIGLDDPAHLNIVTGIGLVESGYVWLEQLNDGPAKGFWQMEPATHDDIWKNSLPAPSRSRIASGLNQLLYGQPHAADLMISLPLYGAAMCATKILLAPEPIPAADDAAGQAQYHKRWYNSPLGSACALANIPDFQAAIAA